MLNAGQPGFVHAPVSKVVAGVVILSTILSSIVDFRRRVTLDTLTFKEAVQPWRLITHHAVFTTPGETLFGMILLYLFRQQERVMGSSRFATFIIVSCTLYTTVLACVLLLYPDAAPLPSPAPGPYGIIIPCLLYFVFETPSIYHFQMFGFAHLSDKSFTYLIVMQLILSYRPHSFISSATATLVALLMRVPPFNQLPDLPQPVIQFFSNHILPLVASPPPTSHFRRRSRARLNPNAALQPNRAADNVALTPDAGRNDVPEGSHSSAPNVETLVSMGFSQEDALRALHFAQDDLQVATDILLRNSNDNNDNT